MKPLAAAYSQRLLKGQAPTYERLQARLAEDGSPLGAEPIAVHCGWGRLLIGHTFPDPASLAQELLNEQAGERDIALYVAAPQQILGIDPQQLFLDPSDTLRLWFSDYRPATRVFRGFRIRRVQTDADWQAVNQLYQGRGMLPVDAERLTPRHQGGPVYWLAEDEDSGAVIGSVMGLNHQKAFHDPENGCSLWCLAVDPQCTRPGVGEVLVRHLVEHFMSRGLSYLDLSVLHDNRAWRRGSWPGGYRAATAILGNSPPALSCSFPCYLSPAFQNAVSKTLFPIWAAVVGIYSATLPSPDDMTSLVDPPSCRRICAA